MNVVPCIIVMIVAVAIALILMFWEDSNVRSTNLGGSNVPIKAVVFGFNGVFTVTSSNLNGVKEMSVEEVINVFGGNDRLKLLEGLGVYLEEAMVEIYIVSYGEEGEIIKALESVGLLKYFNKNPIRAKTAGIKFVNDAVDEDNIRKPRWSMIRELIIKKNKYSAGEVLFVDFNTLDLEYAECKTMRVSNGLSEEQINEIRKQIKLS